MKKSLVLIIAVIMLAFMVSCGNTNSFGKKDLEFTLNGKTFLLDSDVSPLLDELGDDYKLSEAPSCVYEGKDKTFKYSDIEIYTYPLEGKDLIDEIQLTGSKYETKKGISVGDTKTDLINAYGEDYTDEGGILKYSLKPGDMKSPCIYFVMDKDKIVKISYYSASNM